MQKISERASSDGRMIGEAFSNSSFISSVSQYTL